MALDRTWYNALVDDDGTNTVGTTWNKAQVKNLLDSVDLELTRIDNAAAASFASGLWTPTITGSTGGTGQVYSAVHGAWHRMTGNFVHAQCYVGLSVKGTISGVVMVGGLPFAAAAGNAYAVSTVWAANLAQTWSYLVAYVVPGTTNIYIMGNRVPALSTNLNLADADLTASSTFMLNVSYRVA